MGFDPLGDTPVCDESNDANGDGFVAPSECAGLGADNVMFWTPSTGVTDLSDDQEYVITRSSLPY